jgi:hypothetical protein
VIGTLTSYLVVYPDAYLAIHSEKGKVALNRLNNALKVAKATLEKNQPLSDPGTASGGVPSSRPLRAPITSFLKANFTFEDTTINTINDTVKDLDLCREKCDRTFKSFWHLYVIVQQRSDSKGTSSKNSRISASVIGNALDSISASFHRHPFSIPLGNRKGIKFDVLNSNHYASREHQDLMERIGRSWVQDRADRRVLSDAAGKAMSKIQWLGGLQTTLFELLWSGTIEQLKQQNSRVTEDSSLLSDPERKDLEIEFSELQAGLQDAIVLAKKQRFAIAFCGMVKAGKSLFLNSLIGEPILPSDGTY